MKMKTEILLADLKERTIKNIYQVKTLRQISEKELRKKQNQKTWSVLECIEHLNLYGEFYIPEIRQKIKQGKAPSERYFKVGVLGNYFAESMLPSAPMKKIKTFKNKNPNGRNLNKNVVEKFLQQKEHILELLEKSSRVSLNKTKTAISLSKFIKLKLGDTLRVVIYHNERHILQAHHTLKI